MNLLELPYILEAKCNYQLKCDCVKPKLTPKGRLAKNQFNLNSLPDYFQNISSFIECGFDRDLETKKPQKTLYHAKTATVRFNAFPGKNRVVQSIDPVLGTTKYLITNQFQFEAAKMISAYSNRLVVEEFYRIAKQLSDMEGATIRSEQGVALSLHLVSWIDFLLHYKNYQSTLDGSQKESLSIPSIVRQAQAENMGAFVEKVQNDEIFVQRWIKVTKENQNVPRKSTYPLVDLDNTEQNEEQEAA